MIVFQLLLFYFPYITLFEINQNIQNVYIASLVDLFEITVMLDFF